MKEEADRKVKEEADRKASIEAELLARVETAEWIASVEAAQEDADRVARIRAGESRRRAREAVDLQISIITEFV